MVTGRDTFVRSRCVLYVSGFDPKGAGHYHAMLRKEGAQQARRDGWSLSVGARLRKPDGNPYWAVQANVGGRLVDTDYEFMQWDDIVRKHWTRSTLALWADVVTTTWFNIRQGALWRMYRLSWPPAVALFMPFLLVIFMILGAPASGIVAAWMLHMQGASIGMAGALGLCVLALLAWLGRLLESRYSMYWMMRSYAFNTKQSRGLIPDIEQRLNGHARTLVERVNSAEYDEVLLVGHSSGANLAVSILARALAMNPGFTRQKRTTLSLLTLGQWLPLTGTLPIAQWFRNELEVVARATGLTWIDFSAPSDGCCFALCHPLNACGVEQVPGGVNLKVLNPRWAEQFSRESYEQLKKDKFNLHFQYLKSSERAADYDYFATIAGPQTLSQRYERLASVEDYDGLRGWPKQKARTR